MNTQRNTEAQNLLLVVILAELALNSEDPKDSLKRFSNFISRLMDRHKSLVVSEGVKTEADNLLTLASFLVDNVIDDKTRPKRRPKGYPKE